MPGSRRPLAGPPRRYRGTRKNLSGLRRVAVVHNLHIIARQPTTDSYQLFRARNNWYLTAVPELMIPVADRLEAAFGGRP